MRHADRANDWVMGNHRDAIGKHDGDAYSSVTNDCGVRVCECIGVTTSAPTPHAPVHNRDRCTMNLATHNEVGEGETARGSQSLSICDHPRVIVTDVQTKVQLRVRSFTNAPMTRRDEMVYPVVLRKAPKAVEPHPAYRGPLHAATLPLDVLTHSECPWIAEDLV